MWILFGNQNKTWFSTESAGARTNEKKNAADRDMHYTQPWPSAGAWKAKTTKEDVDSEFGLLSSVSSRVKVRIGMRMSARLC